MFQVLVAISATPQSENPICIILDITISGSMETILC